MEIKGCAPEREAKELETGFLTRKQYLYIVGEDVAGRVLEARDRNRTLRDNRGTPEMGAYGFWRLAGKPQGSVMWGREQETMVWTRLSEEQVGKLIEVKDGKWDPDKGIEVPNWPR